MRKLLTQYSRFFCISALCYALCTIISSEAIRRIGIYVESAPNAPTDVYYWLSPTFAGIQAGNNILLWSGMLSCICSSILSAKHLPRLFSLKAFGILLFFSFMNTVICVATTWGYEEIMFTRNQPLTLELVVHTMHMIAGMFFFITFWSLFGYGLRLTLNSRFIASMAGSMIQLAEIFLIMRTYPKIEIYLPTALSRQVIVDNFPFWDVHSWAYQPNAFSFASSPMLVDNKYNILHIGWTWVVVFLIWYLLVVYVVPVVKEVQNKHERGGKIHA